MERAWRAGWPCSRVATGFGTDGDGEDAEGAKAAASMTVGRDTTAGRGGRMIGFRTDGVALAIDASTPACTKGAPRKAIHTPKKPRTTANAAPRQSRRTENDPMPKDRVLCDARCRFTSGVSRAAWHWGTDRSSGIAKSIRVS